MADRASKAHSAAPWVVSALAHLALLVASWLLASPPRRPPPPTVEIELEPPVAAPSPEPERLPSSAESGGAPAPRGHRSRSRQSAAPPPPEPAPPEPPAPLEPASHAPAPARPSFGDVIGEGGLLGGLGIGGGGSGGPGRGGRGGEGLGRGAPLLGHEPLPQPPPPSKARPAVLIYPTRTADEVPGEVFVVLLKVDEDGYVAGVRLLRGVDPLANEKALSAVWRFRYRPALDDEGHPVASEVKQDFMLE